MNSRDQIVNVILTDSSQRHLAEEIGQHLSVPVLGYDSAVFTSTKELSVHTKHSFTGQTVAVIVALRPNLHQRIFEHFLVLRALKSGGAARVISVIPLLPYGRSDKQFHAYGPVGVSVMLDLLHTAGADQVVTVDLHGKTASTQSVVSNVDPTPVIVRQVGQLQKLNTFLIAEDEGALPRVAAISKATNLPYMNFSKQRTGDDIVQLSPGLTVPPVGFHAIIIDDAVFTAATINAACQNLRGMGASAVDVIITHAMLTKDGRKRLEEAGLSKIVVSNSLPPDIRNVPHASVFSIAEPVATYLRQAL